MLRRYSNFLQVHNKCQKCNISLEGVKLYNNNLVVYHYRVVAVLHLKWNTLMKKLEKMSGILDLEDQMNQINRGMITLVEKR